MILVLERGTTEEQKDEVLGELERLGLRGNLLKAGEKMAIHVLNGPTRPARKLIRMERVEAIVPTSGPRIRRHGRHFFPYHFINWSAACLLVGGVLVVLAGFLPPGIGDPVDLHNPPEQIGLPWYLSAPIAFLKLFPGGLLWFGWLLLTLFFVALFVLPLLDRGTGRTLRERLPVLLTGLAVAVGILYLAL